jgi:hypothetical protein
MRLTLRRRRWVLETKRLCWGALVVLLAACSSAPPAIPTITPRPTIEPRTPPTAVPTDVIAEPLTLGVPRAVTLPGAGFIAFPYNADDTQAVTITARALTDDGAGNVLDVVLEVLNVDMDRVAYNDDGAVALDGFAPNDAALVGLSLAAGQYTIRVNTFNGFQSGDVEVEISEAP